MRAIVKFSKCAPIKYISHLDILRMFQRAVKRSGLPVSYSQGFNPHMLLGFACALPTGAMSEAEYLEIRLEQDLPEAHLAERLGAVMPAGCEILGARCIPNRYKSLMAVVDRSDYRIEIKDRAADSLIAELVEHILSAEELIIQKKTKKGIKPTNIRGMIHSLCFVDGNLLCTLDSGNTANLRPDALMQHFKARLECFPQYDIVRTALYIKEGESLIDPFDAGRENHD